MQLKCFKSSGLFQSIGMNAQHISYIIYPFWNWLNILFLQLLQFKELFLICLFILALWFQQDPICVFLNSQTYLLVYVKVILLTFGLSITILVLTKRVAHVPYVVLVRNYIPPTEVVLVLWYKLETSVFTFCLTFEETILPYFFLLCYFLNWTLFDGDLYWNACSLFSSLFRF